MRKGSISSLIFNIFSITVLCFLTFFYAFRLVKYYILEHKEYKAETTKLVEVLMNNKGILGTDDGLQPLDNEYIYGSKSTNNYLYFVGRLWRIVSIDENNNIKLITDESQTILPWSDVDYVESDIYKYLIKKDTKNTGIFELSLKEQTEKLAKLDNNISLLSIEEYEKLNQNNYLVNDDFWIIGNDNKPAYINSKGEVEVETYSKILGVRPVITLSEDVIYISGNGNIDKPYQIMGHGGENITSTYIGEYINFNDSLWRVINIDETGVTISLDSSLDDEIVFGSSNIFNTSNGIGKYLNTTYYNSITNKDYIVKSNYYIGSYDNSYLDTYNKSINVNISTSKIGDFFINTVENVFTINYYPHDTKSIYIINNNKKLYIDYYTSKHKVRPILKLSNELFITSGKGTKTSPYEVGK